ncbi:MAG: phosphatidylserine decarboxylase [Puniceicoccaceae bacterium]
MNGQPITYFDRYKKAMQQEAVYGDGALRFAYETLPGRALGWLFFSRPFFSAIFGWWMKRPASRKRILPFIERYGLNVSEFLQPPESFVSFNDFFCRELKPDARPVDAALASVVFPADGRHLGWQELGTEQRVFVKGQQWDLEKLLGGDPELVQLFTGGSLVLSRLCPVDYHHFHYPVPGSMVDSWWLGKRLYSVSPIALRYRLSCIWENKRHLSHIQTDSLGHVLFIAVGATNVGSIRYRCPRGDQSFLKGEPFGWFEFGGSSVITIFQPGRIRLSDDLLELTASGTELYARVGDRMGISCAI